MAVSHNSPPHPNPGPACKPALLLRARLALPVVQPPIEDAGIRVRGTRIEAVGAWKSLRRRHTGPRLDLGETLVLPGLINAHCHLDYTHMAGMFPPPRSFTDWIKSITVAKQTWSDGEFRASWLAGADMLLRSGTTTVADIEAVPALLPEVWRKTPLRVFSFLEMTGIRSRREPRRILQDMQEHLARLPRGRCRAFLSPHALYSTKPELLQLSSDVTRRRRWLMVTHVAESAIEQDMFMRRSGEMFGWLQGNERDMSDCGNVSPVEQLHRLGVLDASLLAIHVNHLRSGDAERLAQGGVSVAHCPRSHTYFGHRKFPYETLTRAGVNVCLGTDSLASMLLDRGTRPLLNLFSEMREFAARNPNVRPETVLQLATTNAARALRQGGQLGELSTGARADLIAIPFNGSRRSSLRAVMSFDATVAASMVEGRWALRPQVS